MNMVKLWEENSPQMLTNHAKKHYYNDRLFIEINPNPSAYYSNSKLTFFSKTYYMNLRKEEINDNNAKLIKNDKSAFLHFFLKKKNIDKMRLSFKDSSSYATTESMPNNIIKESIALSQTLISHWSKKERYHFDKNLYYLTMMKLKFKKDKYHAYIADYYINSFKKYGFRTANSKLSTFSILNRLINDKHNHKLSLSDLFIGKIKSNEMLLLKEEFHDYYFLAEKDYHSLNFPYYDYSEALLTIVFSENEETDINTSNNKSFSLESYFTEYNNLYHTPLSVFTMLDSKSKNNTTYSEIIPRISQHFKQHLFFFNSQDFLSLCTVDGKIKFNENTYYNISFKTRDEVKTIERVMIELSTYDNMVHNHLFTNKFIENSIFYSKTYHKNNSKKHYYDEYITPIIVFKITLLTTIIQIMNSDYSKNVNNEIIQSVQDNISLFDNDNVESLVIIAHKYVESKGEISFNLIKNIIN